MTGSTNWRTQFPDFPETDMPDIPDGFRDISFRNDICPTFENAALGLVLWIDYPDRAMREFPDSAQFMLEPKIDGCAAGKTVIVSDDWNDILREIAQCRRRRQLKDRGGIGEEMADCYRH